MPNEEDVLNAIRAIDAEADHGHPKIRYTDVAERLGCAADDADLQGFLARASTTGLIETLDEVDQLEGPTVFRFTP